MTSISHVMLTSATQMRGNVHRGLVNKITTYYVADIQPK